MKCNASCLELRLGDQCGRCGGLVDVKKPLITVTPGRSGDAHGEVTEHRSADGSMVFRRLNRPVPVDGLSPSQRLMLGEAAGERYLRHFARQYGPLDEAHREKVRRYFAAAGVEDDSMRRLPRYFVRADGLLELEVEVEIKGPVEPQLRTQGELASMLRPERCCGMVDAHGGPGCTYCPMATRPIGSGPRYTEEAIIEVEDDLALANFQLAHDVVASMSEGPRPRAADDADGIQKAMREIHLAEGRRPISCAPGQHNFQWSTGNVYTCTVCLRGKPEDGR